MLSFVAFAVGLAAWAGVWFLFSDVSARLADRAQSLSDTSAQSAQQSDQIALHALVADTAQTRTQLAGAVDTDVVSIANDIDAAGKASGAQTTIGSASIITPAGSPQGLNELEFLVQSTGSFAQVWRAAQLFETLPLPSTVNQVDFEQLPNSGKGPSEWQLTAHIDVLTSAQVSS